MIKDNSGCCLENPRSHIYPGSKPCPGLTLPGSNTTDLVFLRSPLLFLQFPHRHQHERFLVWGVRMLNFLKTNKQGASGKAFSSLASCRLSPVLSPPACSFVFFSYSLKRKRRSRALLKESPPPTLFKACEGGGGKNQICKPGGKPPANLAEEGRKRPPAFPRSGFGQSTCHPWPPSVGAQAKARQGLAARRHFARLKPLI